MLMTEHLSGWNSISQSAFHFSRAFMLSLSFLQLISAMRVKYTMVSPNSLCICCILPCHLCRSGRRSLLLRFLLWCLSIYTTTCWILLQRKNLEQQLCWDSSQSGLLMSSSVLLEISIWGSLGEASLMAYLLSFSRDSGESCKKTDLNWPFSMVAFLLSLSSIPLFF